MQNNLGLAYWNLPTGDQGESLRQAVACFQAALRVYTETDFPQEWAMTQFKLGLAWESLAEETDDPDAFLSAREHFATAARGFAAVGLDEDAAEVAETVAEINAALAAAEGEEAETSDEG
jgi:hypothetical protein